VSGPRQFRAAAANGSSLGGQNTTPIVMINGSGQDKDSTSPIDGSGGFANTWLRST
jgi:hypothetical protein